MAIPNFIVKTLVMKPEVNKIFDDLDAWLDHCRFELIEFNPAHLYKSKEYKEWSKGSHRGDKRPFKGRNKFKDQK